VSKATLKFRIKIWKSLVKYFNRTCCGPKLEVRSLNTPRIRRLNADLEIQNILFEYTAVILSQTYLACYLVMSFNVPPWQVIKGSLIRIAISLAIDFAFNIISCARCGRNIGYVTWLLTHSFVSACCLILVHHSSVFSQAKNTYPCLKKANLEIVHQYFRSI
jgi:hypothetical protein